jgi:putative ABC transport system ATP-binding protein
MSTIDARPRLVQLRRVRKVYPGAGDGFTALAGVDLTIAAGDFVAVVGKSGSGKTTLIHLIAGIDRPTSGEVVVGDAAVHDLGESELAAWRGRNVGIVFQFFQLLPTLTIVENVMLPMDFCGTVRPVEARERAMELLARVRIADQALKLPAGLSGGQQQRAAIARALANDPPLIVADEPTGNLDSHTAQEVLELLATVHREGKTVVMVTHERDMARIVDRIVTLADGCVVAAAGEGHA